MKIRIAHPNVPPFARQSALAYYEAGVLDRFYTTFMDHPDYWLSGFIRKLVPALRPELKRRTAAELPLSSIRNFPWREISRTAASRFTNSVLTDRIWEWAELGFDRWVAKSLSDTPEIIHVYEHAGLFSLEEAKKRRIFSVYEQPSQHHAFFSKIAHDQILKYPELKDQAVSLLVDEKAQRRNRRRDAELQLADLIICNSGFTRRTLIESGINPDKIQVIPYGFPEPAKELPFRSWEKLTFLNAGTQNLRKAMHLLYFAWKNLNVSHENGRLMLIGKMNLPESTRQGLPGDVFISSSIPHQDLMQLYLSAHIFVLPTLADGFGMVISEAMSRGLIVITTQNSGGPDIITDKVNGLLIPAGDQAAIESAIRWCFENKHLLPEISKNAWLKSKEWQWSHYRKRLPEIITSQYQEKKLAGG